jgi:uncharacterized protein DUF4012
MPVQQRSRPTRPRRRILLLLALVAMAGLCWLLLTGLMAKREIDAAQHNVDQLKSSIAAADLPHASQQARQVSRHALRAHQLTTGPAWWLAAQLPWMGGPVVSVRGCAAQLDSLSTGVLEPLIGVIGGLTLDSLVQHGTVQLQPLVKAAPVVATAEQNLALTSAAVSDLPDTTWLAPVNRARRSFQSTLAKLQAQLDSVQRATATLPKMLGEDHKRRYFVGLENEAESRGLGGIPGAFVILTADHGRIAFERFSSDKTLERVRTALDLGSEYQQRYGPADPANTYPNSTISPDFTDAARIWAAMWQRYSGEPIDGAIAVDPTAISYLLTVTGPAIMPGGERVTGDNVVAMSQQTLYDRFPNTAERKSFLVNMAAAIAHRLVAVPGSPELIRASLRAAEQRRLLVWSADPAIEQQLRSTSFGGTLNAGLRPFAGFTTVNATGGKLDYYLKRSMSYQRVTCGNEVTSTATFTLVNAVDPGPLPAYVTLRSDKPRYRTAPGDNKVLVSYYGTPGSAISSVTVDGRLTIVAPGVEKGLTVFTLPIELKRGSQHSITVTAKEPPRAGSVQILRQPAVSPLVVAVQEQNCG